VYNLSNLSLSAESISTLHSGSDFSDDLLAPHDGADSAPSLGSDDGHSERQAGDFHLEAAGSVFDSLQQGDESTNIQLELNALRMSTNASPHQVRRALVAAFMKQIAQVVQSGNTVKHAVDQTIRPHLDLFRRNFFDHDADEKEDQVDFLLLLQQDLAHRPQGGSIMFTVSYELLTKDILQVEGFEQWWTSNKSQEDDGLKTIRTAMQQFIGSILDDSSEEESEDEDEDSE
jgi:translation initiation factor eIF-2B subunit epsilon